MKKLPPQCSEVKHCYKVAFLRPSATQYRRPLVNALVTMLLLVATTVLISCSLLPPPDPTRVTNLQDNGVGSLRWAVANVPSGSTITFNPGLKGTIVLTSADLNIAKNLTIRGPVNSGNGYAIHVLKGFSVTISDLIFKDSQGAGAIHNEGMLTLTNSIISGNTAFDRFGGGIYNEGTLTISNSTVSGNMVESAHYVIDGGSGIYNSQSGILTISNSTVSDNSASGAVASGGGIYNEGSLRLINSTVSGNSVSYNGGGIYNEGMLAISNSTVSGNSAFDNGGGIYMRTQIESGSQPRIAQADLTFSTIYGNKAFAGADIMIADTTISHGISSPSKQISQMKLSNSIVAAEPAHRGPDISGTLTSYGYNLFQNNSSATFDPSTSTQHSTDKTLVVNDLSKLFADPLELRDNGGPTRTYALAPGSQALDQIPLATCHVKSIITDQRGVKRPDTNEDACDIGAYESSP